MANHKRKRPKNRRAGCLMCKPHKGNGAKNKDKPKDKVPRLTKKMIEDALKQSAKGANELREQLERSNLEGVSHSMALVLD